MDHPVRSLFSASGGLRPCGGPGRTILRAILAGTLLLFQAPALASDAVERITHAARTGDLETVRRLAAEGVDLDAENADRLPAIAYAAANGHLDVLRLLLEKGADPNRASSESGSTALHLAAQFGRTDCAGALLEAGAEIDRRDQLGMTPLIKAAYSLQVGMVRFLLGKGADPAVRDARKETALEAVKRRYGRFSALVPGPERDPGNYTGRYEEIIRLLEQAQGG